ncbi:hypothetical protein DL546_003684 [Coniochaeta pulveracea]|uniref:CENP-V/GFA domain-containing protein n=1 Tax=Coniochaeta pulveracea TaxID=177199 RepID=A0A420Y5E4_9PEZI|nr:hypothetical protein DL546_003684 [Coniochaeta pulveracea]
MASSSDSPSNPWYTGSCHCKHITYRVQLNLTTPNPSTGAILTKCNCSICHKTGMVLASPQPDSSLTILTPADGKEGITFYRFGKRGVGHNFCSRCGVRCFFSGEYDLGEDKGGVVRFTRVNALTLDGREDGEEMEDLRGIKLAYYGFKDEVFASGKEPFKGGIW